MITSENKPIESLSEYLSKISSITCKTNDEIQYFYRGQRNEIWTVAPAIERDGFDKSETKIIESVLSDRPGEFINCSTMFEKLVKMQHYGIPTRIVDITSSPLIALFFACEQDLKDQNNNKVNGKVFVYSAYKNKVLDYNSDKVRLLANMTRMKEFEYCPDVGYYDRLYLQLIDILEKCIKIFESSNCTLSLKNDTEIFHLVDQIYYYEQFCLEADEVLKIKSWNKVEGLAQVYKDNSSIKSEKQDDNPEIDKLMLEFYNISERFINCNICMISGTKHCKRQLLSLIREEKPAFDDRIIPADLKQNYFVKGIKANERIKAQFGDFIITSRLSEGVEKLHNDEILIDTKAKLSILKELDQLGINASTIYPEFTKYSDYVKEKFSACVEKL